MSTHRRNIHRNGKRKYRGGTPRSLVDLVKLDHHQMLKLLKLKRKQEVQEWKLVTVKIRTLN